MIVPLSDASKTIGAGPEAVHLFAFPADAVKSIVLGSRMLESKKEEIQSLLSELPQYSHVCCKQAEIDAEHYLVRIPS